MKAQTISSGMARDLMNRRGTTMRNRHGFTLIELLIVVAIIGILAAIAIPNFLEAQMRAKAATCYAEMRDLGTALEVYRVDNAAYPIAFSPVVMDFLPFNDRLIPLTTPVAYLTSLPIDIFQEQEVDRMYDYLDRASSGDEPRVILLWLALPDVAQWRLASVGPDRQEEGLLPPPFVIYDGSNGTVSRGDILRWGP